MEYLFHHIDEDGDELRVQEYADRLIFWVGDRNGLEVGVRLRHSHVVDLLLALGEWRYPVHTPEAANRSLIEQLIERAVENKVAAILPLHLSPAAYVHGRNCPGQLFCQDANGTQVIDCQNESDPEPGEIGHPRPPVEPEVSPPFKYEDARPHSTGRLLSEITKMSEIAKRVAPAPACQAPRCGHEYADHVKRSHGMADECVGTPGCTCVRYRSTP